MEQRESDRYQIGASWEALSRRTPSSISTREPASRRPMNTIRSARTGSCPNGTARIRPVSDRSVLGGALTENTQFHFYTGTGVKTPHEYNTIGPNGILSEWNSANPTGIRSERPGRRSHGEHPVPFLHGNRRQDAP